MVLSLSYCYLELDFNSTTLTNLSPGYNQCFFTKKFVFWLWMPNNRFSFSVLILFYKFYFRLADEPNYLFANNAQSRNIFAPASCQISCDFELSCHETYAFDINQNTEWKNDQFDTWVQSKKKKIKKKIRHRNSKRTTVNINLQMVQTNMRSHSLDLKITFDIIFHISQFSCFEFRTIYQIMLLSFTIYKIQWAKRHTKKKKNRAMHMNWTYSTHQRVPSVVYV